MHAINWKKEPDYQPSYDEINLLFQRATEGLALFDIHLNIITANKSFETIISSIFLIKIDEKTNFKSLLTTKPFLNERLTAAIKKALSGEKQTITLENISPHVEEIHCYEFNIEKVNDTSTVEKLIFQVLDLTTHKKIEIESKKEQAQLARNHKRRVLKEMSSTFAHELSQPLAAIKTYCYGSLAQLRNNTITTTDLIYPLEKIALHTTHATELVERMRNLYEVNFFFEPGFLHELIKKALDYLFYETLNAKVEIAFQFDPLITECLVDRLMIMQLFINLGKNSIEALKDNKGSHPKIVIKTQLIDKIVHIDFFDNGPGIPKHIREKLRHSHFTTKPQGSGLGLSICKAIIAAHGGAFQINQCSTGAWFHFTLVTDKKK